MAWLGGCATVEQGDLDAWRGSPVAALETHPYFARMQMTRKLNPDGRESRTFLDTYDYVQCAGTREATPLGPVGVAPTMNRCETRRVTCSHVFLIRNGVVDEYAPIGACHTDASMRPRPAASESIKR